MAKQKTKSKVFLMGITIPKIGRFEAGQEATKEAIAALEAAGVKSTHYIK